MKKRIFAVTTLALALVACGEQVGKPQAASSAEKVASVPAGLETQEKQFSYVMGYELALQAQLSMLKDAGIEIDQKVLLQAMNDQMAGKTSKVTPEQAQAAMEAIGQRLQKHFEQAASAANAKNQQFLDENKTQEGVKTTESGLQYKVNKEGAGNQAKLGDLVMVDYEGRLVDGTVFDSSKNHGDEPAAFPVVEGMAIPGFLEALQLMKEGGEYTVYIPADLAYGAMSPSPKIPANSILIFDIKLHKVVKDGAKGK